MGDQYFDQEIGSSIDRVLSGISTSWKIAWDLDQNIVLVTVLVLVASPLGYDWWIVAIQIDTTI